MPESDLLKRFLDAGLAFTQLTQARAEAIVKDLVSAGEVQTNQAQAAVADLVERSRENTERLFEQVRSDIRTQVENMGLATKTDVARLEQRIADVSASTRSATSAAVPIPPATTTTPAKSTPAKRNPAKRSPAKRNPAKAAAKRSPAKKSAKAPAKARAKAPAKKSAKAPAKKR